MSSQLTHIPKTVLQLEFYQPNELKEIINMNSEKLQIKIEDSASYEIAKRSRGTPRIVIRLLKRIIDFSVVQNSHTINMNVVLSSLKLL